ncbi:MAG: DNA alkylation repair protein [Planctomycetota bacterium]|nr:DNA alkylation repair protein [Planctomycetota bacterium]
MSAKELVDYVVGEFESLANPEQAKPMAAYMKTTQPFYGIKKPERVPVYRQMKKRFPPKNQRAYLAAVKELWTRPHRECQYAALEYACYFKDFVNAGSMEFYEQLVREGAWWDLVDVIAAHLVGKVLLKDRETLAPVMDQWIDDDDCWIRRTALLSQCRHKEKTDEKQLFSHCLKRANEKEFFIRKAIGWALREYSYADPKAVKSFLLENKAKLSGLSLREGAKGLIRNGLMEKSELSLH